MTGRITSLRGAYGFIAAEDGRDYFFHADDQADSDDFELRLNDRVRFEVVQPEPVRGPRARQVMFVGAA